MKTRSTIVGILALATILSLGLGCGSSGSSSGSNVTITGTLATGDISAMTTKAGVAASGYTVVVHNNASNQTYNATTDATGSFSVQAPSGSDYMISLVSDGSYIGPIVFDGSGTSVNTAITLAGDTALGTTTVDTTNGYARTATAPLTVASGVTAVAVNGIPVGSGNDGSTEQTGITNRDDSDMDQDGIPNLFDADEDNDGFRNGIAVEPSTLSVVSTSVDQVYMSSNIWADHGILTSGTAPADIAPELIALRLHVVPISGQESMFASVACSSVPASIATDATVRYADSLGNPTSYPTEGSLWSAASYGLYNTTTLTPEEWIISIAPNQPMNIGDTFSILVTYTDSTTETFYISMPYVLTDWARILTYNSTTMPNTEGTSDNPVVLTTNTLEIDFSKPRDETGVVLAGLSYSVRYGPSTWDAAAGRWLVPSSPTEASTTTCDADSCTYTLTVPTGETYYVTPVAESVDGQRNGEETWFTGP